MALGHLVIAGGGLGQRAPEVLSRLDRLGSASRPEGRIAILPAASEDPEASIAFTKSMMERTGIDPRRIVALPVCAAVPEWAEAAQDPEVVELIAECSALWMTGGSQDRLYAALVYPDTSDKDRHIDKKDSIQGKGLPDKDETPLLAAIRRERKSGLAIGGSSAGAAVMSNPMIRGGSSLGALSAALAAEPGDGEISHPLCLGPGFGFFDEGVIDQHFDTRARFGRLIRACTDPGLGVRRGFGIAEATSIIHDPGTRSLEVMGSGTVIVLESEGAALDLDPDGSVLGVRGLRIHLLRDGDRYNAGTGRALFPTRKCLTSEDGSIEAESASGFAPSFDLPCPEALELLSPYGDLAGFTASMLLDNHPGGLFLDPETGARYVRAFAAEPALQEPSSAGEVPRSSGTRRRRAWEIRFSSIPGCSALYSGEGLSYEHVGVAIYPRWMEIYSR